MHAIVLVRPRNPLNIGAAARAMSNFGFTDLRLVEPYRIAMEEARSGVKAEDVLAGAREYATVAEAVADCHVVTGTTALGPRETAVDCLRLEDAGRRLRRMRGRAAILFGSEKFGLSNEDMGHCHWLIRIPTRLEHRSMNLGQAVAVTLYELVRKGEAPDSKTVFSRHAESGAVERVTELLTEALCDSGFVKPPADTSQMLKIRRLVRRMNLSERDAVVWQGMMRQIVWGLKNK